MNAMERLERDLLRAVPKAQIKMDRPDDKSGAWWLDANLDGHAVTVEWRPRRGFGISATEDAGYGEGADEVIDDEKATLARVVRLLMSRGKTQSPREAILQQIREQQEVSQEELARLMSVSQSAISKLERRPDMHLSTLRRLIEALGGELELRARFQDRVVRIKQS